MPPTRLGGYTWIMFTVMLCSDPRRLLWNREMRCSVAVRHRGAHQGWSLSRRAYTRTRAPHLRRRKWLRCDIVRSAAGSGVRSAPRWSLHRSFTYLLRLRTLRMSLTPSLTRSASARAQRLRDGDSPSCHVCRRCHRTVQLEALAIAHDLRDPLGGLAVPPLDDGSGRRAPPEGALGCRENRIALWLHEAIGPVRA